MDIIKSLFPRIRLSKYIYDKYGIKYLYDYKGGFSHSIVVCEDNKPGLRMIMIGSDKLELIKKGELYES